MILYLKQQSSDRGKLFMIFDEDSKEHYRVTFEMVSFGKRMHMIDQNGRELFFIKQNPLSAVTCFEFYGGGKEGQKVGVIEKRSKEYEQKYIVELGTFMRKNNDNKKLVGKIKGLFAAVNKANDCEQKVIEKTWNIAGDFHTPEYNVVCDGTEVANIARKWFKGHETVKIDIKDGAYVAQVIAAVAVISESTQHV